MNDIASMDLWEQASLPPDAIRHPLVLGTSGSSDVIKHMKLKRRTLTIVKGQYIPGWTLVYADMLTLLCDQDDIWQGLTYGMRNDLLTWQVESVVTRGARTDGPDATAGEMPLLLLGAPLQQFAALPLFVSLTNGNAGSGQGWRLKGRDYDKWLSMETALPRATLTASFLLKVTKVAYETRYEIDYYLHELSVMTPSTTYIVPHGADPA